jgi:hypothetical protein
MKRIAFVLLAIATITGCAKTAPIIDFPHQQIKRFDNKTLTHQDVQNAIRRAADEIGWRVEPGESGHIIATFIVRSEHVVVVDISYTSDEYSITYKDSQNMKYRPAGDSRQIAGTGGTIIQHQATIHPHYNKWVRQFNDEIFKEMQK